MFMCRLCTFIVTYYLLVYREGEYNNYKDGYRDQIVTTEVTQCDVGVSLLSKIHLLFMLHSNGSVMHTNIQACFLYLFYNPFLIYLYIIGTALDF